MKVGRPPDLEQRALVESLLDSGLSQEKVAIVLGVTPAAISTMCKRMGISATQRGLMKSRGRPPATSTNTKSGGSR